MGEEVTQSDAKNSAGNDESDKATPAQVDDECSAKNIIDEVASNNTTNCNDGSVNQPQAEKSPKKPSSSLTLAMTGLKPQDNSFEKSKKWYNISFMHRTGASNSSRSANVADNKNSIKMDNRHSWHLNESLEM